jgi:hypothetical protein
MEHLAQIITAIVCLAVLATLSAGITSFLAPFGLLTVMVFGTPLYVLALVSAIHIILDVY